MLLQVNGAAMAALEERLELLENGALSLSSSCSDPSIELSHFEQALSKIEPSVSEQVHDLLIIIRFASP
jgi:ribosome biogenesis ATPase